MRTRFVVLPLLAGCAVAGCSAGSSTPPTTPATPVSAAPVPGGAAVPSSPPPAHAMDALERPVARRLARQVRTEGLDLTYLDCPPWDGQVPARMTCAGYVDGLVADVQVHLATAVRGRAVDFDARLSGGVIATRRLEATLRAQGWRQADCGRRAAHPAAVGSTVVCRVRGGTSGRARYVVATVRSRAGAVTIADDASASPAR